MSVLTGKNIIFIGEDNKFIRNLKKLLIPHGMNLESLSCEEATPEKISSLKPDVLFLNYLKKTKDCKNIILSLRQNIYEKTIPSFVLVEDTNIKIQEVITYGATDYVTPLEKPESLQQKLVALFAENYNFPSDSSIDITPVEVPLSSKGIKVYVVEDDPLLRNLLSRRLEKSSFPFEFSKDGKNVVTIMKQFKPNVIVLDLMLPGKSGFEVLSEIKEDNELKDIPVIVFSNRDGQDDRNKAQELGAVAFYVKAMTDLSKLIEKIETLTKKSK